MHDETFASSEYEEERYEYRLVGKRKWQIINNEGQGKVVVT